MKNSNILWHKGNVTYEDRCKILNQKGVVIWFTGLSGSGKSTIAVEVEKYLIACGKLVYRLDGDNIRYGLNSDLGFSKESRQENVRRIAEVAALFRDAGVITLVATISPYRDMRSLAREIIGSENFIEVYVKADLDTCRQRDPKGLYQKVKLGEIKEFTGVDAVYEEPINPDLIIDTQLLSLEQAKTTVLDIIQDCLQNN